MKQLRVKPARHPSGGFSLVEVIVMIGVIGVLASVALFVHRGSVEASRRVIARENTERLNGAVWKYNQIGEQIEVARDDADTDDEAAVMALLQTRDSVNLPGSPFLPTELELGTSDSEDVFRARWTGIAFEILAPGVEGEGVAFGN
jgi:type II secretory pathway pseudopilin PulG